MAADGSVVIEILGDADDITSKLKGVANGAVNGLKTAFVGVTAAIGAASAAVGGFAASSVKVGMSFDSSMAQVAATMGKTVDEIQDLRDFAMEMGAKTAFSATEAADALNYMALAGYDAETSMQMLLNVLNLAAAGGIDLAYASDMVTDAQSALGLTLDETTEMVDKMAKASSKSNTSVAQLGEAILTVGGTAKNLAGGTTELATSLGILADNGVKGAEGGTALRNIILSLSAPTDKAAKSLKTLGVEVFDAEGNMRPLNETFGDLNDALSSMTQGEQTQVLSEIFNKVDLKSVNALLANTTIKLDGVSDALSQAGVDWGTYADTVRERTGDMSITAQDVLNDVSSFLVSMSEAGMSAAEQQKAVQEEFGLTASDAAAAISAVGGDALSLATSRWQELTGAIDDSRGAAEQMAQTQLDNLAGDITKFKSALEGVQLLISGSLASGLREFVQMGTDGLSKMSEAFKSDGLSGAISVMGETLANATATIAGQAPALVEAGAQLLASVGEGLISALPSISDVGTQILGQIQTGILSDIPSLISSGLDALTSFSEGLLKSSEDLVDAGIELVEQIGKGLIDSIPVLVEKVPTIVSNIANIINKNAPKLLTAGVKLIGQLAIGLVKAIPTIVANAPKIIGAIVDVITAFNWLNLGKTIIDGLVNGIKGMIGVVKSSGKNVLDAISGEIKSLPQTLITIGKNGINGLINGIKSMISTLGGTVKTVASTVVNTFKSLPGKMIQIGKDILTGIWNGISDKVGWLKQQVSGVVDKIKSWFTGKKGFDTHSPSKWGEQVGEYVGEGLGNGFEKSTAAAVKSAEKMGTAVQDAIVESVDRAKKAGDKSLSEFYDGWSEQAINAWTDYRRYGAFDLNAFYQSGSPYGFSPTTAGFWNESTHTDLYKGWTFNDWDYRSKNWDPLAAIEAAQKELQWGYDNFEAYAKANMSAPGNMPKELASTIVPWLDDDKIREKAKAMGIDLSEALNEGAGEAGQSSFDERFEAMRSQLEKETKYRKLSLQEQYKGWKYIQDQYEEDSAEYVEAEKQLESLRESIYDDYLEKVRDTLENIVDLEENYQNELKSRTAEIQKTYGLFGRVPEREVVSADYITRTLQGQIATMEEFYSNLDKLSERGAPTELVDQLRDLGVDAVDEVAAITNMTDKELEKYVDLFQQKNKLAVDQATKELAPLREETDQKIMEQLQSATDLYNENVALVGEAFTDGLAESIRAGMNDVVEAAQDVIRASMRAAGMETGAYFPTKSEVLGNYDIKEKLKAANIDKKLKDAVDAATANVSADLSVTVNSAETKKKLEGNSARLGLADPTAGWNSAAQPREVVLNVNGIPLARTLLPDIRAAESETPAIRDDPQGVIPLAQRIS